MPSKPLFSAFFPGRASQLILPKVDDVRTVTVMTINTSLQRPSRRRNQVQAVENAADCSSLVARWVVTVVALVTAVAQVRALTWELLCAMGAALPQPQKRETEP